jgi:hypothetical protein
MVNNKDYYECKVIKSDKDLDVALLKVDANKKFKPILIGDSSQLKVGNLVITIGYPLASVFFEFFKDLKSTMTTGLISAIRSDNWGIQHTSAINPGNSGGPLLNKNGELIGINVGVIYDANGLYFSIPINKVKTWLNDSGYNSLVQINRFDSKEFPLYKNIDLNYADMNNKIHVKLGEGYRVYVNGEYKGKTPITLENLPLGVNTIRVDSDNEYFEQKFNIKKISNEAYGFIPLFNKNYGKLIVNTNPVGIDIYLDGILVGKTPYNEDITTGKHNVKLSGDGYVPIEKDINIAKNEYIKINEKFIKGIKVTFKDNLPEDAKINIKNKNTNLNFNAGDVIYLLPDKYELLITTNRFDDQILNIDLTEGKDIVLELKISKYKSRLILEKYDKAYSVFVDNDDVTDKIADDNSIYLYEGTHQLKIMDKKKKKLNKKIIIERDRYLIVNLEEDD